MFTPVAERRLEPVARDLLSVLPGAENGVLAVREVAGPFGVPDFVAVIGPSTRLKDRRLAQVPPLLHEVDAGIVAASSPSRPLTPETIATKLGWSMSTVERRLPYLLRSGAVTITSKGTILRNERVEALGQVIAVEMKVRNWRRALTQCRTYRLWADSYVLILEGVSDGSTTQLIKEVRRDRGGLVVAGEILLWPRTDQLPSHRRLWGSEHVFAATIRPSASA